MTVEADLVTVIKPLCARVFPDFAPVCTQRPYVTYQQIGGEVVRYTDDLVPSIENGAFQFNVWANSRMEAKTLIKQIESALIGAKAFQARPLSAPVADFDADVPVYGARQDFSIWSAR